ncbi:MAG: hypothetical protein IIV29_07780, partial [Tidjanibacter sp.]|nr:hypothetical protein [Tidjanibacter sp.]
MKKFCRTMLAVGLFLVGAVGTAVAQQARSVDHYAARADKLYGQGHYRAALQELKKARAAAANVGHNHSLDVERVDFLEAMSVAALGRDTIALGGYLSTYPNSIHSNEARYTLAREFFELELWQRAVDNFAVVNTERLSDEELEEWCFEYGFAAHRLGDDATARDMLTRVDGNGPRSNHAKYLLGYIAYTEGYLLDARLHFGSVADSKEYKHLVPYYLFNIEHRLGNNRYVAEGAEGVLEGLKGGRRAEVMRIAAQSCFALEKWKNAADYVGRMAEEGVALSREENYLAGYALYRCGKWADAASYLRAACGADDALTQNAAYHLADCYLRTEDKTKAMQAFSMVYGGVGDERMRED